MDIRIDSLDGGARLVLTGRFDFNAHREFRQATEGVLQDPALRELVIDFSRVDYIDSSALGMLLLLREKAENKGKCIVLSGVQGMVREVLTIANFGKLFTIRELDASTSLAETSEVGGRGR